MTKNRIAATAALATFGLAALGGIALAAPGYADTGVTTSPSAGSHAEAPRDPFPTRTTNPHEGQGHKGLNEPRALRK
jgi:hypothetical protein